MNPDSEELYCTIIKMLSSLMEEFQQVYGEGISKEESDVIKHADKIDVLWDTLKDIDFLLRTLGRSMIV